jgi:hypothetical protein
MMNRISIQTFRPDTKKFLRFGLRCPIEQPHLDPSICDYLEGDHHISLKQVPSVLTLKHAGSLSVEKQTAVLSEAGFAIEEFRGQESHVIPPSDEYPSAKYGEEYSLTGHTLDVDASIATISVLTQEDEKLSGGFTKVKSSEKKKRGGFHRRILYEDYFSVVAGRFLADINGFKNKPRVKVWHGDVKRLQDQISPSFFRWKEHGCTVPRNTVRFQDVSSVAVQMDFLRSHTHWGAKLTQMCKEESDYVKKPDTLPEHLGKIPTTARTLWKVIADFLKGKPDPRWTTKVLDMIYENPKDLRKHETRSSRFMELLKTVDGITVQRMCCYPHEHWTYEKYDLMVLHLIWELISDEFVDGELKESSFKIRLRFSDLKKARKIIKMATLRECGDLSRHEHFAQNAPWTRFLLPLYKAAKEDDSRFRRLYVFGMLSQTRGVGKPPPLSFLQAKIKFLETCSIPDTITDTALHVIRVVMAEELRNLPDHIFSGLKTKASISVNSSSTWEKTQAEEGTLAAVQEFCSGRSIGEKAMIYDLDTGTALQHLEDDATAGEYIFWRALEELLWMTPENRRDAALVVVGEPGKCRAITKTRACVKIVLDLVNKICAVPLEKGFSSSRSGMRASNHAWNLFRSFEEEEFEEILFNKHETCLKGGYTDYDIVEVVYKHVFAVSTDYETATDFLSHKVAREIGLQWMHKCGIPKLLRDLVCEIAYGPRNIHFHLNMEIGEVIDPEKNLRKMKTCRGVLMGDPLTKIVLHFTNIVTRAFVTQLSKGSLLPQVFGFSEFTGVEERVSQILGF